MNLLQRKPHDEKQLVTSDRDPFSELVQRFWKMPFPFETRLPEAFQAANGPAMNVSEDEGSYQVSLDLPGLEEKDIDVQLMGRQLVVSGERTWQEEKKEKEFHRVESQYGSFQRSVTLPADARCEPDSVEATYAKGILTLTIPKVEPTPTRKIAVKSK